MREDTDGSSRIDYGIILTVMLLSLIGLVSLYVAISMIHLPAVPCAKL